MNRKRNRAVVHGSPCAGGKFDKNLDRSRSDIPGGRDDDEVDGAGPQGGIGGRREFVADEGHLPGQTFVSDRLQCTGHAAAAMIDSGDPAVRSQQF